MKTRYFLSIVMSAAALLTACNTGIEAPSEDVSGELVTLEATIGEPSTKLHFTADKDTYTETRWEAGDCIWVKSDTQPVWEAGDCFKTSASDISSDGHSAKFTGRTRRDGKICAVYPYQIVNALSGNDAVRLDISGTQAIVPGDCPAYSNAAVAFWADGSTSFAMKYVFGALRLSIKGPGVKVSSFELTNGDPSFALWGTCVITPDYGNKDIKAIEMEGTAAGSLELVPASEVTLSGTPYEFYVMLPEGALAKGFTLKAKDATGTVVAKLVTDKANTIVRGKVVKMPTAIMTDPSSGSGVTFKGQGTEDAPYIISTAYELIGLANYVNSETDYDKYADKYYVQTADIEMMGKDFTPIGAYKDRPFKGVYRGDYWGIYNLATSGLDKENPASGIFGYTDKAKISGILATGRVNTGAFQMTGGIVGYANETEFSNCMLKNSKLNSSADFCGGIVGSAEKCSLTSCFVLSSTISGNEEVGGIAGKANGSNVKSCGIDNSSVSSATDDVGGIIGWCIGSSMVYGCYNHSSEVNAKTDYAGGTVGLLEASQVQACTMSGTSKVIGGKNCIGGIVGYAKKDASSAIVGCVVCDDAKVSGIQNVGGIVGWLDTGVINQCTLRGNALVSGSGDGVGGMAGRAISKNGTENLFLSCRIQDNVVIEGAYSVGGILGYAYPDSKGPVNIINCGVLSGTVRSLSCDTNANPAEGDCMSAGIVGRMRLSDAGSEGRIINCFVYVSGLPCVLPMTHPSLGAFIGYGHITSTGKMEIQNCCTNLGKKDITLAGSVISDTSSASQVGALFGKLPNSSVIKVTNNVYMQNGLGIGVTGANTVVSDNYELLENQFIDGTTAQTILNSNLTGSIYTLNEWTADSSGRPVLK